MSSGIAGDDDKHSYSFMSRLQDTSHPPDGDFVDGDNKLKMDVTAAEVSLDRTRTASQHPLLTPVVYLRDVFVQTLALLRKNVILYWRRWPSTIAQIISPIIIIALLWALVLIVENVVSSNVYSNPLSGAVDTTILAECTKWRADQSCYKVAYAHNNNEFAKDIMHQIKLDFDLKENDVKEFTYQNEMEDFFVTNPNVTATALDFSNMTVTSSPQRPANLTSYTVYYNATNDATNYVLNVQTIVDETIIMLRMKEQGKSYERNTINIKKMGYPRPQSRVNGQIVIFGQQGPLFFCLAAMTVLINSLNAIVVEKEYHITFGMKVMGMKTAAYWISWAITFVAMAAFTTLITIALGAATQIYYFIYANFFLVFAMFFLFSISMICMAFLLSAFVNTGKAALILGFIVLAISFILNAVLAQPAFIHLMYAKEVPTVIPVILTFYPPFNFAKIFADMAKTAPRFDPKTRTYVSGDYYTFHDAYQWSKIGGEELVPPMAHSLWYLAGNSAIFLIIGWYFYNVLPQDSGVRYPPWFFLTPSYWGIRFKKKNRIHAGMYASPQEEIESMDEDIRTEYYTVRDPNKSNVALRIVGLKKTFRSLLGKSVHAVKKLNLVVGEGQCIALLGHNGAGKCWGKGTDILMYDGTMRPVEDLKIGDLLMGDDGTPRRIISEPIHGKGQMYHITPKSQAPGRPFSCNDDHILVLRLSGEPHIRDSVCEDRRRAVLQYMQSYVDDDGDVIVRLRDLNCEYGPKKLYKKYNEAKAALEIALNDLSQQDNYVNPDTYIWEVRAEAFFEKVAPAIKNRAMMYMPGAISFPAREGFLRHILQEVLHATPTDDQVRAAAYLLGSWLGDGKSTSPCIFVAASEKEQLSALYHAIEQLGCGVTVSNDKGDGTLLGLYIKAMRDNECNPFLDLLRALNIYNNKHIPEELALDELVNVRYHLLAGLLDTDGHFESVKFEYDFVQKRKQITDMVHRMANISGFRSNNVSRALKRATNSMHKTKEEYWRCVISGPDMSMLPISIPRKRDPGPYDRATTPNKRHLLWGFTVAKLDRSEEEDYHGFTVDGNSRLLLADNTVTHNSTTFNMITGLIRPDKGDIYVHDKSCKYEISEIRKRIGYCPQHDILLNELTAREHLELFAVFKNIPFREIKAEVNQRLKDVSLFRVGNKMTKTFSGGMKRRLSVAISCIGDPNILLLDEPTTGMDSSSMREVWNLINSMKGGRVIVLTTHSMEEADALADRIALMAGGELRCVGDSLTLKRKYGAGYNLTIVSHEGKTEQVQSLVQEHMGSAAVLSTEDAGNMIFTINPNHIATLAKFLRFLEDTVDQDAGSLIKDWAISNTTLEEVYLTVTNEAGFELGGIEATNDDETAKAAEAAVMNDDNDDEENDEEEDDEEENDENEDDDEKNEEED